MNDLENRNLSLAVTLSMAVLFGWQLLVIQPELEKSRRNKPCFLNNKLKKGGQNSQDIGTPVAVTGSGVHATPVVGSQNSILSDTKSVLQSMRHWCRDLSRFKGGAY